MMRKAIYLLFLFCCGSYLFAQNQSNADIPALIKMNKLKISGDKVVFPKVRSGYQLSIVGSEVKEIINTAGEVHSPFSDTSVMLYLQLVNVETGDTSFIENVPVKVKGKLKSSTKNNRMPSVIPSLREWNGGKGALNINTIQSILIDPAYKEQLQETASTLAEDLRKQSGYTLPIEYGNAKANSIFLTLNCEDTFLGNEGYYLTTDSHVAISATHPLGAYWATRTLLQLINNNTELPKGTIRDYPKYKRRGFMIDVARKFISMDFLENYVQILSYYKMNELQVHLNDNAFKQFFHEDWNKTYAAFRLECSTFPGLTSQDGSYSKAAFTNLQRLGMKFGVNVIPEIDTPAHSLSFVQYRPSLGSKAYGDDHLELNVATTNFLDSLYAEYLSGPNPVFIGPDVHIGTDEYSKEKAEEFRAFTDHYLAYVQAHGKVARVWGALSHAPGVTPVRSKGVIMNAWYNGFADPKEMIKQGYELISTPDKFLYIVPVAGYYFDYLNLPKLYNEWEPNIIADEVFPLGHPSITGGMFALWNDHAGNGITEKDAHHRVFPALQMMAQKMWKGTSDNQSFDSYQQVASQTIEAPGINMMGKLTSQSPLVLSYSFQNKSLNDLSGNAYAPAKANDVVFSTDSSLLFRGISELTLPVAEIGYNYTVEFDICLNEEGNNNSILFQSPNAKVVLNPLNEGGIGFIRENYKDVFTYRPELLKWTRLAIQGDNKSVALFADGKLIKKLSAVIKEVKTTDRVNKIHLQKTLVFPLSTIGDAKNSFRGELKNLKVYNEKIYKD